MLYSMTAYANKEIKGEWGVITCEIKSVNSRYLECIFRLPESIKSMETTIREVIRQQLFRGKVDCVFKIDLNKGSKIELTLNESMLSQLLLIQQVIQRHDCSALSLSTADIMNWPGVIESVDSNPEAIEAHVVPLLKQTLIALKDMRHREGERLAEFIRQRCQGIREHVGSVRQQLPEALKWQQSKIRERFADAGIEYDPERLEQELVLMAQKMDVAEELDRLDAHIEEISQILEQGGQVGRRLDFMMQELNREANTLCSKSINGTITASAIELKVLIEQIREQIQNLE